MLFWGAYLMTFKYVLYFFPDFLVFSLGVDKWLDSTTVIASPRFG